MQSLSDQFTRMQQEMSNYVEITVDLNTMFKRDYEEFLRDRKRWKSDFDQASNNADRTVKHIKELVAGCLVKEEINSKAI